MSNSTPFLMATDISQFDAINQLHEINGVPLAEVEKRARPKAFASSGFLAKEESFKEVLESDWKTVANLKTTHIALAKELKALWDKEKSGILLYQPKFALTPFHFTRAVAFQLAAVIVLVTAAVASIFTSSFTLLGYAIAAALAALVLSKRQLLYVTFETHKGKQADLFQKDEKLAEPLGWNTQMNVMNLLNGEKIIVGKGVMDYIEKYGFYEGGSSHNSYRIDPARLVAIFSGVSRAHALTFANSNR